MEFCKEDYKKIAKIVLDKACDDEEFRSLCFSEPEEALKKLEEEDIPEELKLTIVENMDDENNLPDENELIVELGNKESCRYKFREKGISSSYIEANEVEDDYCLDDVAEVEE